jgi:hypothetical protein
VDLQTAFSFFFGRVYSRFSRANSIGSLDELKEIGGLAGVAGRKRGVGNRSPREMKGWKPTLHRAIQVVRLLEPMM